MFCGKCGKQIEDTDRYCSGCGEPQFGAPKPDSEFKIWLRRRRMLWVVIGAVLVVLGILFRRPQFAVVGAAIATVSLMALNKLDKP